MIHGSCLCGAVRIEIQEPLEHAPEACRCTQRRKQTGSYLIGVKVRRTASRVLGEDSVAWYRSSTKVERGFCRACGSTLFWKPDIEGYAWTSVTMGCLDTALSIRVAKHTFLGDKEGYYEISDGAPQSPAC